MDVQPVTHLKNAVKLYAAIAGGPTELLAAIMTKSLDVIQAYEDGSVTEAHVGIELMIKALYRSIIFHQGSIVPKWWAEREPDDVLNLFHAGKWPELHAEITKRALK